MFDLNSFKANSETVITLTDPKTGETVYCDDDKKDPMTWTLLSRHTKEYKKLASDLAREVKREFGKKAVIDFDDDELEKMQAMTTQLLVAATVSFNLVENGAKAKFSKSKAEDILSNPDYFLLRKQVEEGSVQVENFMQA